MLNLFISEKHHTVIKHQHSNMLHFMFYFYVGGELYQRLKDMFRKWIRPEQKSVEEVAEDLILEQFFRTLSPEVRVWVKEHKPQTGQQAAVLVENFLAARRGPKIWIPSHGPIDRLLSTGNALPVVLCVTTVTKKDIQDQIA